MGYGEANMFISGLDRRYRASWETHRSLIGTLASICGEKSDIQDLMPLPWDENEDTPSGEQNEEELQKLMDQLNAHNAQIKAQNK